MGLENRLLFWEVGVTLRTSDYRCYIPCLSFWFTCSQKAGREPSFYVEIDFADVTSRKIARIRRNPELRETLGMGNDWESSISAGTPLKQYAP